MGITRSSAAIFAVTLLGTVPGLALADERPVDIVSELYDNHPYAQMPPGGMSLWWEDMQALWAPYTGTGQKRGGGEGLDFDFMTGTEHGSFGRIKITNVIEMEYEAQVRVVLDNGGDELYALNYGFVRDDALGWQISEVWQDDSWFLSELLRQTR